MAHALIWTDRDSLVLYPKIAVDLFMVISGFLMAAHATQRMAREPLDTGAGRLRFWLRRFFRIAPGYYLALSLAVLGQQAFLGGYLHLQALDAGKWNDHIYDPARIQYGWGSLLLHFSFLFGLHPTESFSTFLPDWSLSLEMQFYLAFPALWLAMRRFGHIKTAVVLTLACMLLNWLISMRVHFYEPSLLPLKLQYFLAGMLLFRFLQARRRALAVAAVALTGLEPLSYLLQFALLPLLMVFMVHLAVREQQGRLPPGWQRLLQSRLVRVASDLSYGVYLFHGFMVSACGWLLATWPPLMGLSMAQRTFVMLVFVLAASYAVAAVVHRWVELPGIALGRRLVGKVALAPSRQAA